MSAIDFNQQAIAFADASPKANFLGDVQQSGLDQFKTLPFPSRKTEDWKYTSLYALTKEGLQPCYSNF